MHNSVQQKSLLQADSIRLQFIILILTLCFNHSCLLAQDYYPKFPYQVHIETGIKYHVPDYLGGPSLGLSLYSPKKKIGFIIRSDYMVAFHKQIEIKDTMGNVLQREKIVLSHSILQSFAEIDYRLITIKNYPLTLGLGWGWVTGKISDIEGLRLNYPILTLSIKIPLIKAFFIELRSNFPYTFKLRQWNTPRALSAIPGLAVYYRFGFKKKNK